MHAAKLLGRLLRAPNIGGACTTTAAAGPGSNSSLGCLTVQIGAGARISAVAGAGAAACAAGSAQLRAAGGAFAIVPLPGARRLANVAAAFSDATGAMYALHAIAEQHAAGGPFRAERAAPALEYRALKVNCPWSAYRPGDATARSDGDMRTIAFWEALLDSMVESRLNVLSIWAMHPWPYMTRAARWPLATALNDTELAAWQELWRDIFRAAAARGVATYVVDWNIYVGTGFLHYDPTAHTDLEPGVAGGTLTAAVKEYNREILTQVLDEYPLLTGIGLSLGDAMHNLNLSAQVAWAEEVVFAALEATNRSRGAAANRPALIYRAAFGDATDKTTGPAACRRSVERFANRTGTRTYVQIKFNWSHGHSTTALVQVHGGGADAALPYLAPPPAAYRVTWMVRNEDFFFLRWARPAFIRAHVARNGLGARNAAVGGYAVGSEGFVPATDYAGRRGHTFWRYSFEKFWLFYRAWGRLLYDPATPDAAFAAAIAARHGLNGTRGQALAAALLDAWSAAGVVPLAIARTVRSTWDFTLHAEGFLQCVGNADPAASRNGSCFISVETLVRGRTLDPALQSVADYAARGRNASLLSPLQHAAQVSANATAAAALLNASGLAPGAPGFARLPGALQCEVLDLWAWAELGLYFSAKLRAAAALALHRVGARAGAGGERRAVSSPQQQAVVLLVQAQRHWQQVVRYTGVHLRDQVPLLDYQAYAPARGNESFSWRALVPQVQHDIEIARRG
eukprot:g506.t1